LGEAADKNVRAPGETDTWLVQVRFPYQNWK